MAAKVLLFFDIRKKKMHFSVGKVHFILVYVH